MQEVFEKIVEKLEWYKNANEECRDTALIKHSFNSVQYFEGLIFAIERAISFVKEVAAEDNNGWILCSKWLPEDGEGILATDGEYVYLVEYDEDLDAPFGDLDKIIAWQPLPEPYKLKGE